jgi:4-hydroxy-3-polyprenylbenzoate decarboxylase
LDNLDANANEIHVILSRYAPSVIKEELPEGLRLSDKVRRHSAGSMQAPFVSGSNPFDAMVVIPCSMGTLGRIAHATSENALLRAADVMLKERRQLILAPRETPLNLAHVRNFELLLQAGATILPLNPSYYSRPDSVVDVVDTVVARVLDHLRLPHQLAARWQEERD